MHDLALSVRGLTVRFGEVHALHDVDIDVERGSIVGLIGANGAGKTTFIDAVSGLTPATGSVMLEGRRIERMRAHARRRAGLARTFQSGELFDELDVFHNVAVAAPRSSAADVHELLADLGLTEVAGRRPNELVDSSRKMVGVARAVVGSPRVLLLDEPAAGARESERDAITSLARRCAARGIGVVLVEHDVEMVMSLCDRMYALDFGRVIAAGTPAEVRTSGAVRSAYLGAGAGS